MTTLAPHEALEIHEAINGQVEADARSRDQELKDLMQKDVEQSNDFLSIFINISILM